MACLYEDYELSAGQEWPQESITGSLFRGKAYVTLQGTLVIDEDDAFAWGIRAPH